MRVVTLLRKPLAKGATVTLNSLAYGTGGINVDGCRVGITGGTARDSQAPYPLKENGTEDRSGSWARTGHGIMPILAGRYPANLIVQHLPGCTVTGTVKSSYTINQWTEGAQPFGKAAGKPYEGSTHEGSCDVWSCIPSCVAALLNTSVEVGGKESEKEAGVARFFKQVRE